MSEHLYKKGSRVRNLRKFENRYGREKGKAVYGAVVGKVYRETHAGKNWNTGKHYCLKCGSHISEEEHRGYKGHCVHCYVTG